MSTIPVVSIPLRIQNVVNAKDGVLGQVAFVTGDGNVEVPRDYYSKKQQVTLRWDFSFAADASQTTKASKLKVNSIAFKQAGQRDYWFVVEPVTNSNHLFTPNAWLIADLSFAITFDTKFWYNGSDGNPEVFHYAVWFDDTTSGERFEDRSSDPTMRVSPPDDRPLP